MLTSRGLHLHVWVPWFLGGSRAAEVGAPACVQPEPAPGFPAWPPVTLLCCNVWRRREKWRSTCRGNGRLCHAHKSLSRWLMAPEIQSGSFCPCKWKDPEYRKRFQDDHIQYKLVHMQVDLRRGWYDFCSPSLWFSMNTEISVYFLKKKKKGSSAVMVLAGSQQRSGNLVPVGWMQHWRGMALSRLQGVSSQQEMMKCAGRILLGAEVRPTSRVGRRQVRKRICKVMQLKLLPLTRKRECAI